MLSASAPEPISVNISARKISCVYPRENCLARIRSDGMSDPGDSGGTWTLLTGHGHVLVEIARDPRARIRDLETAGYLTRTRTGRRTRYTVNHDSLFRHSAQEGLRVGPLLALLSAAGGEIADDRVT
jgi:hypothetical protein